MKLLSVNVAQPREVVHQGKAVSTGIFKTPAGDRVMLRTQGLDGDCQADLSVHGGIHKAAYLYPFEHYGFWAQELGRDDLVPGQFGENFTTEDLLEEYVHIGDVFRIGAAMVQVTQPRAPCFKLGVKMNSPTFPKRFLQSGRSGFYLRVLEEGEVGAGDAIERLEIGAERVSVRHVHDLRFVDTGNAAEIRRAMDIPALAPMWRKRLDEVLARSLRAKQEEPAGRL